MAVLPEIVTVGKLTGSEVVNESVIVSPAFARMGFVLLDVIDDTVIVGFKISSTVTSNHVTEVFPAMSVELHET